jgi:hypothetical protein
MRSPELWYQLTLEIVGLCYFPVREMTLGVASVLVVSPPRTQGIDNQQTGRNRLLGRLVQSPHELCSWGHRRTGQCFVVSLPTRSCYW